MTDPVPPLLWYLLYFIALTVFPLVMILTLHRQRMKALEILRSYAEKGEEPPAAMAELLMRQIGEPNRKWQATPRGLLLKRFMGLVWIACIAGAIAWWRVDAGGPRLAVYAAVTSTVFFGVIAFGLLLAALTTREQ